MTTIIPTGGGDALDDEGVTWTTRPRSRRTSPPKKRPPPTRRSDEDAGGIETKAQIIALVVTFAIFLFILDLVRRRRLSERYAIIWMIAALALLVLSIWTGGLDAIADLMGIQEPANAIFIIAFAVGFLLLLNFSVVSSRLGEEIQGARPGGRAPRAGAPARALPPRRRAERLLRPSAEPSRRRTSRQYAASSRAENLRAAGRPR